MMVSQRRLPGVQAWRSAKLSFRLGGAFAVIVLMMGLVVAIANYRLSGLDQEREESLRVELPRLLAVQSVNQHVQGLSGSLVRLLTSSRADRERLYPNIDTELGAVERLMERLVAEHGVAESATLPAKVCEQYRQYRRAFVQIVEALEAEDEEMAKDIFSKQGGPTLTALQEASVDLLEQEQAVITRRQDASQRTTQVTGWFLMGFAGLAAAIAAYMAWWTAAAVARPLRRVEEAALRIAEGDYSVRVRVGGGEEFSQLAIAMNTMAGAIRMRESEVHDLAYIDRLTGLPNRATLRELLVESSGEPGVALMLDISRLRSVNEALGFEAGDSLLIQVADRLRKLADQMSGETGKDWVVSRMPGDSFCILCVGGTQAEAERFRLLADAAVERPVKIDEHEVDVQFAFGLAELPTASQGPATDVLRRAEQALDRARHSRQRVSWFYDADDAMRIRRLDLVSRLKEAASGGQLEMWMQPKQCVRTRNIVGMEGLVRWNHPTRGYISPQEFIPFAEQSGYISVITRTMLECAARTLGQWKDLHQGVSVSVNVSAVDLRDASLVGFVQNVCARYDAPIERLRLEITESSVMEDAEASLAVLGALRALGLSLSVDDFGTGYSSLAYLNRLPVDELKIDRSFVSGVDTNQELRSLLRTVVELGHSLGMSVTAEGVEREEELEVIRDLGCDVAQGYLVSKPLPPVAAASYLGSRSVMQLAREALRGEGLMLVQSFGSEGELAVG